MHNDYLIALSKIVHDLNTSIDQNDHHRFINLCAALQEFRKAHSDQQLDEIENKQQVIDMIPQIDTLIEKIECNKQKLTKEIFSVRKSIQISKNQGEL